MIENEYGQPVGEIVENLGAGSLPQAQLLQGRFCRLEKLPAEKHGSSLREVYASLPENWTYLSIGPITDADGLEAYWPSWSNLPTRIGLPLSNRKADGLSARSP